MFCSLWSYLLERRAFDILAKSVPSPNISSSRVLAHRANSLNTHPSLNNYLLISHQLPVSISMGAIQSDFFAPLIGWPKEPLGIASSHTLPSNSNA